ncbi:MAG: hypothetical protein NT149_00050 [Candidatus Gottesmanbacteria bacterium]|nr:hypothetical protein [Candidatus Gottesmanbacteria bacterium]
MYPKDEVFPANEQELIVRREGLTVAARTFLKSNPDALAIVYIGSVLFKRQEEDKHFDTDFIVITKPEFTFTTEEVDVKMNQHLAMASEKQHVNLPYADAYDVVKVHRPGEPVILGKFQRDYGNLVVGRTDAYFEKPSERIQFRINRY